MNTHFAPSEFRLPSDAHPRIEALHALWLDKGEGDLPASSQFDLAVLSAQYPLLARIGMDASGKNLMWLDFANAVQWPFKAPVKNRPLIESVPLSSIKRVVAVFKQTLTGQVPDYHETTCWMVGGHFVSVVRLALPVRGEAGPEVIASWEIIEQV